MQVGFCFFNLSEDQENFDHQHLFKTAARINCTVYLWGKSKAEPSVTSQTSCASHRTWQSAIDDTGSNTVLSDTDELSAYSTGSFTKNSSKKKEKKNRSVMYELEDAILPHVMLIIELISATRRAAV